MTSIPCSSTSPSMDSKTDSLERHACLCVLKVSMKGTITLSTAICLSTITSDTPPAASSCLHSSAVMQGCLLLLRGVCSEVPQRAQWEHKNGSYITCNFHFSPIHASSHACHAGTRHLPHSWLSGQLWQALHRPSNNLSLLSLLSSPSHYCLPPQVPPCPACAQSCHAATA